MALALSNPFSSRNDLDPTVGDLQRAMRFMGDEAILRNSVLRIHFILNKEPQEYGVEYGPSDNFILPSKNFSDATVESKDEEDKKKKSLKDLNLKFNRVSEFAEKNFEIPSTIRIVGVANAQSEKLQTKGEVSLYAFPSGERDASIVIVASEDEMYTLKTNAFTPKIEKELQKITPGNTKDIYEAQVNLAKEIFEKWKSGK